jgi:hypothetical protein
MTDIFIVLKDNKTIFPEGNINGAGITVFHPILTTDGAFTFEKTYRNKETGELIRNKEFIFDLESEVDLLIVGGVKIYPKSEEVEDVNF